MKKGILQMLQFRNACASQCPCLSLRSWENKGKWQNFFFRFFCAFLTSSWVENFSETLQSWLCMASTVQFFLNVRWKKNRLIKCKIRIRNSITNVLNSFIWHFDVSTRAFEKYPTLFLAKVYVMLINVLQRTGVSTLGTKCCQIFLLAQLE